jgi:hypothetical protein
MKDKKSKRKSEKKKSLDVKSVEDQQFPKVMKKEQFFHFRLRDEHGNVLPRGGATVLYLPFENMAYVGISICSPFDNFSKSRGRKIARERALYAQNNLLDSKIYPLMSKERAMNVLFTEAQREYGHMVEMKASNEVRKILKKNPIVSWNGTGFTINRNWAMELSMTDKRAFV